MSVASPRPIPIVGPVPAAEAQRLIRRGEPCVFRGMAAHMGCMQWTPAHVARAFGSCRTTVRFHKRRLATPPPSKRQRLAADRPGARLGGGPWEGDGELVQTSLRSFVAWMTASSGSAPDAEAEALSKTFDRATHWGYADYKHLVELFGQPRQYGSGREYATTQAAGGAPAPAPAPAPEDSSAAALDRVAADLDWSAFGLSPGSGIRSTFWLGSAGAESPLHFDTFGVNLHLQVHGKKRWRVYPPGVTKGMYATRLPYEESSVFSQVGPTLAAPDPAMYPRFGPIASAAACECVLEPGDVIYVPKSYWHKVDVLGEEPSVSVNCWIDHPRDVYDRVGEAVVRCLVEALMTPRSQSSSSSSSSSPTTTSAVSSSAEAPHGGGSSSNSRQHGREREGREGIASQSRSRSSSATTTARSGTRTRTRTRTRRSWLNPTEELWGTRRNMAALAVACREAARAAGVGDDERIIDGEDCEDVDDDDARRTQRDGKVGEEEDEVDDGLIRIEDLVRATTAPSVIQAIVDVLMRRRCERSVERQHLLQSGGDGGVAR